LQFVPFSARRAMSRVAPALRGSKTPATEKTAFIKDNTHPGETVLILSYNAGPFHLYAGTRDPLNLPGLAEVYLKSEIDGIARLVESGKYPVFVDGGVFKHHTAYAEKVFDALERNYYIAVQSPAGISLCLPRGPAKP
jgi:hypothetical protein